MRPQVADPFSTGGLSPGGIITPGISESLKYLSGMIYIENGQVVDASSGTIVDSLPSSIYRHRAIPDGPLSRIFSLDDSGSQSAINIFNLSTYAPIKSFEPMDLPIRHRMVKS
jgi:hypothetical protein